MILALLNDQIVEASHMEKGEDKQYKCPLCNDDVILRKGDVYIHHFAHRKDSTCEGCDMTLTHRYAQKILLDSVGKDLWLPSIKYDVGNIVNNVGVGLKVEDVNINCEAELLKYSGNLPNSSDSIIVFKPKSVRVQNVYNEPVYDGFRPDIEIVTINGCHLFVEIRVRHSVDAEKRRKLIAFGVPTIEIDLSYLEDKFMRNEVKDLEKEITDILFTQSVMFHTRWVVEPNWDSDYKENASGYLENLFSSYKYYREKYKWYIFFPERKLIMEDDVVSTIKYVNEKLNSSLSYEGYFSNHLKDNYCVFCVEKNGKLRDLYENNDFYKNVISDTIVSKGYIIKNGMIITDDGECMEYDMVDAGIIMNKFSV